MKEKMCVRMCVYVCVKKRKGGEEKREIDPLPTVFVGTRIS